ncbi:hypothetical protein QBC38DRAFT_343831, partial [Podospora fimiseda]
KEQLCLDILALLGLLGLITVIIWIHVTSPLITSTAPLSGTAADKLALGIAMSATLFTMFVISRVRHGLIRSLESKVCNISSSPSSSSLLPHLEKTWRAVLRIDNLSERWSNLSSITIFLRYLITSLLTASIVSTFTPRTSTKSVPFNLLIPGPSYPVFSADEWSINKNVPCAAMISSSDSQNLTFKDSYKWRLKNESIFTAAYNGGINCPFTAVLPLVSTIDFSNPEQHIYVDSGIAIQKSALGAPRSIFSSPEFFGLSPMYGSSLRNTTQCVPVLKSNPVKCKPNYNHTFSLPPGTDNKLNLITYFDENNGGGVIDRTATYSRNLAKDSVMLNYLYANNTGFDQDSIGNAAIIWAGRNDVYGKVRHAEDLATTMGMGETVSLNESFDTFVVECSIQPKNHFEYREVTLVLNYSPQNKSAPLPYTRALIGGEKCIPEAETVGYKQYVAAVTAQYKMVLENLGVDGYFSMINRTVSIKGEWAFKESSRNGLGDLLGVVAAIGVSTVGVEEGVGVGAGAEATIDVSGFSLGLSVFLLVLGPPVLTVGVLGWLVWGSFLVGSRVGG